MIYVTVGTDTHQFNRLLREIDRLVGEGRIRERVVAQTGSSDYLPRNYAFFRFTPQENMEKIIKESRIIISHAGVGSVITACEFKKPLIIVPRLKIFGEHTDDHQTEIAKELENQKRALAVFDISSLQKRIAEANRMHVKRAENKMIKEIIERFIGKNFRVHDK